MKLHSDKESFSALLTAMGSKTGIRTDIIEKDYYVTLLLWELAQKQGKVPAYFKGGTALYKAIGRMKRFSEDIDLTVEVSDCSKSQGKKRLEAAANGYTELCRTSDKTRESNQRGSITSVYEYIPITEVDRADTLQRFGYVKVEATSFTISEPTELLTISPLLYSEASEEQKKILEASYKVMPFQIQTIKMERIFTDKILAAEFYYQRKMLFDTAKHLYDLAMLMEQERIQKLLANPKEMTKMLAYKRREEEIRIGSGLATKPFSEFEIFPMIERDQKLLNAFQKMQSIYVFSKEDVLLADIMSKRIEKLAQSLLMLNENLGNTSRAEIPAQ